MIHDVRSTQNEVDAPSSAPTLETDRLVLRPWRATDVAGYARIIGDPEVMRYLGFGARYRAKRMAASLVALVSDTEARRTIRRLVGHWRRYGFGEWAVEERGGGALIGQIGLVHHPDWTADPANVEIGWLLARSAWGKGFATEGGRAALAYAFEQLGLERVVSIARPANWRSERVMQRLGLSFAGATRWKGGEVLWYALDREDWIHRRAQEPD